VTQLGGSFHVGSAARGGASLTAEIPLAAPA